MENFCYIDSICYKLKYFNRISMNINLSRKCRSLSTTLPFAIYYGMRGHEIGLGLDSENNNIRICITSGAAETKKS